MTYEFIKMRTLTWNYRIQDKIEIELYYLMVTIASDQKRQPNLRVMWLGFQVRYIIGNYSFQTKT